MRAISLILNNRQLEILKSYLNSRNNEHPFMKSKNTFNFSKLFLLIAEKEVWVWKKIVGTEVEHNTYGAGNICEVNEENNNIYISIEFMNLEEKDKAKKFTVKSFMDGYFKTVNLDDSFINEFMNFCEMEVEKEAVRLITREKNIRRIEESEGIKNKKERLTARANDRLANLSKDGDTLFDNRDDIGLIEAGNKLIELLIDATVVPQDIGSLCKFVVAAHLNYT